MKIMMTLIWSEWRRQRKTVLFLLASTILLWLFMMGMVLLKTFVKEIEMTATALVIGLPFLYCIALGGSFANEFSDKSKSFLLGLPVSKTKIYFAKYLSNLLIFLSISIAASFLMYTLTDITPGKAFFDNLGIWTRPIASTALMIIWILSHTTVFLYNLISRNTSSGVIALLTLPIIFVIVSFGTSAITMFFLKNDQNWIIAYTLLSSIIIYLEMIIFGWYLWNRRISRDLKALKPIGISIVVLFIISAILYSFNYIYSKHQYESTLIEAKQSGLQLEIKRSPHSSKIPDALNGMADLLQFAKDKQQLLHDKTYKKFRKSLPSYYSSNWDGFKHITKSKQAEIAKYVLNNTDMLKLYLLIEKALKKPSIQSIIKYDKRGIVKEWLRHHQHTSAIRQGIAFLLNRACVQVYLEDKKAFFKTLGQSMKLYHSIDQERLDGNWTGRRALEKIYNLIIKIGPEGSAYTDNYINALNAVNNNKIYNPPYITYAAEFFAHYKKMPDFYKNKPILKLGTSICQVARFKQILSFWIRNKIENNNLYLEAQKTNHIKKIVEKYSLLYKNQPKSFGPFISYNWEMPHYFILRSKIAGDKVCLALKIYRCRYGKYPEKLQELCPEILKKVPFEPRTEKPYIYKREGKGFLLEGEKDKVLGAIRNPEYYSKTYYMKYQPWNPQGKEKKK